MFWDEVLGKANDDKILRRCGNETKNDNEYKILNKRQEELFNESQLASQSG